MEQKLHKVKRMKALTTDCEVKLCVEFHKTVYNTVGRLVGRESSWIGLTDEGKLEHFYTSCATKFLIGINF